MLRKFSDKLLTQLSDDISKIIANETEPFKILSAVLGAVRSALKKLKDYIEEHPFKDKTEEIEFFKYIKPEFYSLRIFYLEKYNIDTSLPSGDTEILKNYYHEEIKAVNRFFKQIYFHYQYYRLRATELDNLYFVRGVDVQSVLIPEVPELDREFATSCDYLFSKIKAYELLQDYLLKMLGNLNPTVSPVLLKEKETAELRWTGDKVNLVEVIYGFYFTGQLNNGNADIAVIIRFMEKHLQIDLSRAYRDFIDIRNRKASSPTRYIEQMRESIHKRVDDDLALKPVRKYRFKSIT
ncbi:RteC domain-containing protein [Mucilaginibacter sp. cycad4]|uniref:RteC domain-containing protein n=1 Tax=Mucilaginibacter sp. cycad4 TaxID=3342096 RepID=UPI002AAA7C1B|nr:RteC domain-containing protein [Mucilaginibacter gossypii]WPU97833.1 RteC domain-containing protein [Mucilaginibacter gossypii]